MHFFHGVEPGPGSGYWWKFHHLLHNFLLCGIFIDELLCIVCTVDVLNSKCHHCLISLRLLFNSETIDTTLTRIIRAVYNAQQTLFNRQNGMVQNNRIKNMKEEWRRKKCCSMHNCTQLYTQTRGKNHVKHFHFHQPSNTQLKFPWIDFGEWEISAGSNVKCMAIFYSSILYRKLLKECDEACACLFLARTDFSLKLSSFLLFSVRPFIVSVGWQTHVHIFYTTVKFTIVVWLIKAASIRAKVVDGKTSKQPQTIWILSPMATDKMNEIVKANKKRRKEWKV